MSIEIEHIRYVYMKGTPFEHFALDDVDLCIEAGSFIAVAGHTGSGKSTFLQMLNGLLHPSEGRVSVDGTDLQPSKREKEAARDAARKVGMVFQYPEQQLFEETIEADISFGPRNLGLADEEVQARVREAMAYVGLEYGRFHDRSPFSLSGGQMRRVAIAGILALRPKYLVLDEPTAGLDPVGREELVGMIRSLHEEKGTTIIFVSHNMDDIARLADKVLVLAEGKMMAYAPPQKVFSDKALLQGAGLRQPEAMEMAETLRRDGVPVSEDVLIEDDVVSSLLAIFGKRG